MTTNHLKYPDILYIGVFLSSKMIYFPRNMNVILLGPQGSGKGTQGEMLSKEFNLYYFEAGDFLRNLAKEDAQINHIINEVGALIPDNQVFSLVKDHLIEKGVFDNICFDGYPRSVAQYNLLKDFLKEHNSSITVAFVLEIPEAETIRRLTNRRMDPSTHKIYNLLTNPPGPEVDPAKLVQRADDTEPVIKKRLAAYRQTTEPLVLALKNEGKLVEIDGTKSIEEIFSVISEKFASLL